MIRRNLILLTAAFLTLAPGIRDARAQQPTPVATTPLARPDKQTIHENLAAGIHQAKPNLIFIGDSITENFRRQGSAVWDKYYAKRSAFNLGVSADRTQHVLWRLDNGELDGISPKVAVILIGTNNAGNTPPEEIAAGVTAIAERVRTKLPDTKILLMGIFPRGEKTDDPKRLAVSQANEKIAGLDDGQKVFYLDITPQFLSPDGTIPRELMADFLHPTQRGHEIWAEAMEPLLARLMGDQ